MLSIFQADTSLWIYKICRQFQSLLQPTLSVLHNNVTNMRGNEVSHFLLTQTVLEKSTQGKTKAKYIRDKSTRHCQMSLSSPTHVLLSLIDQHNTKLHLYAFQSARLLPCQLTNISLMRGFPRAFGPIRLRESLQCGLSKALLRSNLFPLLFDSNK